MLKSLYGGRGRDKGINSLTFLNRFSRSVRRNTCRGCSALCSRLEEMWDKCIASVCSWSRMEDQWLLRELRVGGREGEREGGGGGGGERGGGEKSEGGKWGTEGEKAINIYMYSVDV